MSRGARRVLEAAAAALACGVMLYTGLYMAWLEAVPLWNNAALPVLLALLLQAMYGAVDLQVVGKFGTAADISAVSTGSQIMQTVTIVITGLAMGITVLLGQKIGEDRPEEAGAAVGSGICLFLVVAVAATVALELAAPQLAMLMHAPADAFDGTVEYVRICSGGAVFIVAYNLLGSIFRGGEFE